MIYVLYALLLFCASVMSHISFCRRTAKTGLQAKACIAIAFLFLGVYAWGVTIIQQSGVFPAGSLWGLPFVFTSGFMFILLFPIYLCFYVLTQIMSPSKKILSSISARGNLSYRDIVMNVKEEDFIMKRLNDLEASGCVKQVRGRYILSLSGRKIAGVLDLMQGILGRDMGG